MSRGDLLGAAGRIRRELDVDRLSIAALNCRHATFRIVAWDGSLRFKQIAGELAISETTAKGYARSLFRKLGASSRAEGVFEARRRRLLD